MELLELEGEFRGAGQADRSAPGTPEADTAPECGRVQSTHTHTHTHTYSHTDADPDRDTS